MTRPIKFRAWCKERKKMFYLGWNWTNDGGTIPLEGNWAKELGHDDELEFQQFTGLTDKNGKEIYEGDILKNDNGMTRVVRWSESLYAGYETTSVDGLSPTFFDYATARESTVIGNVYENRRLPNV